MLSRTPPKNTLESSGARCLPSLEMRSNLRVCIRTFTLTLLGRRFGQIGPDDRILGSRLGQEEIRSPRTASGGEASRQVYQRLVKETSFHPISQTIGDKS